MQCGQTLSLLLALAPAPAPTEPGPDGGAEDSVPEPPPPGGPVNEGESIPRLLNDDVGGGLERPLAFLKKKTLVHMENELGKKGKKKTYGKLRNRQW